MLQMAFREVYRKFKLHFYEAVFRGFETREATLTTVETFCMEIIYALKRPTVAEFARITNISGGSTSSKSRTNISSTTTSATSTWIW